jgi:hypothetical protein
LNPKSSASLHLYKGNKPSFANTQRISHKKNMSAHSVSKFSHDIFDSFKTTPQKPLLTQMKSKKHAQKFDFNLHQTTNGTRKTTRNSVSK